MESTASKKLILKLQSERSEEVLEAIAEIRNHGRPEHLAPLYQTYKESPDPEIANAIGKLFDDLKDQRVVGQLVDLIRREHTAINKRMLVASCWKSGLDYSAHMIPFFEIFIKDDFETAFEAYTLIDSNIHNSAPAALKKMNQFLTEAWSAIPEDRLILAQDLKQVLESYI